MQLFLWVVAYVPSFILVNKVDFSINDDDITIKNKFKNIRLNFSFNVTHFNHSKQQSIQKESAPNH